MKLIAEKQLAPARSGVFGNLHAKSRREPGMTAPEQDADAIPYLCPITRWDTITGAEKTPWCVSRTKRAMDVFLALLILLLSMPVFIPIAIAIKLEGPGPIFFKQWRTGLLGNRFRMWKFRTMVQDAEKLKDRVMHLNQHSKDGPDFKIVDDPRITKVGKLLRKTSLDELPNLISVLQGHMSLIGPRPTSFGVESYEDWHLVRLTVPPGITGLWQISGRSEVDFDDRVKLDYQYIRNQSAWLDLKILLRTPMSVLGGRGAC